MIDTDGFREYLCEEELSQNTVSSYMFSLKRFAEQYTDMTKANVIAFKQMLISKGFKPQTVNLRITALLAYCKYKEIPMRIKLVKEQRKTHIDNVITAAQVDRLLDGLKSDGNLLWYFNILLLAKTGARISEALRFTKKDILTGSTTMHTKAHMRTIYFPQSLTDEMQEYLANFRDDDRVMRNQRGKPLYKKSMDTMLKKFAARYGIPRECMHAHAFRHFFAIEFLKRNNNIALLADILGHTDVKMTQLYLRQSQEQQKDAVDRAVDW